MSLDNMVQSSRVTPETGAAHEDFVRALLEARGWSVWPYGTEHRSWHVSGEIAATTSALRQTPDFLGINGKKAVLFDAKGGSGRNMPNHAIEARSIKVGWGYELMGVPVIFVFEGGMALRALEAHCRAGRVKTETLGGSGDPYRLIPKTATRPLDEVLDELS